MAQQQKCPQCGTQLYNEYYTSVVCPMCGWGKAENAILNPPSGLAYKLSTKSRRWKFGAAAIVLAVLLLMTPLIKFSRNQLLANQAVATARKQMDERLYASAARTLNEAPRAQTASNTKKQLNSLLSDTVRWAHDISDADSAKTAMLEGDSEEALDDLGEIDEDFPQEDEAIELGDMAQDMELDEDVSFTEEELDETLYIPEDPEMSNLGEIEAQAAETEEGTADAGTDESIPPSDDSGEVVPDAETGADDPLEDEVTEEELPEAPAIDSATPANAGSNKKPRLVTFFQMTWDKKGDRDNFYTIDQNNEVAPGRDKKSGFSVYTQNGSIGQIYNRKPVKGPSMAPLYRYWSAGNTNHYYTTNRKFAVNGNSNYVRQQVAGYVGKWDGQKCLAGNKPLYSLYYAKATNNIYTANPDVKNKLVSEGYYKNPEIIGCIW